MGFSPSLSPAVCQYLRTFNRKALGNIRGDQNIKEMEKIKLMNCYCCGSSSLVMNFFLPPFLACSSPPPNRIRSTFLSLSSQPHLIHKDGIIVI